ncbi:phage portal protein [Chengkuizengella sp. SCS-71B]|uniref:XkdQ/YqbQ family protein n=1 Tax=Chengkuizengella sp. SCS-71B TaxID=3115290 RepID=UPI0032C24A01
MTFQVVLNQDRDITDLIEKLSLTDSMDQVAYSAELTLIVTEDLQKTGIHNGQTIQVFVQESDSTTQTEVIHGVIWHIESTKRATKRLEITVYDLSKYLTESEEEYLFTSGQTANQRLKEYANDWNIPLWKVPDTQISLAKSNIAVKKLSSWIQSDLHETANKGGKLYRVRMWPKGLELFELGSNEVVWEINEDIFEEIKQTRTLNNIATKVKVLGKSQDKQSSPVLAVEEGETNKYGTLQKIIQDSNMTTATEAKKAAQAKLSGYQENFSAVTVDIHSIRAGDLVHINNLDLIVTFVRHELGNPGRMEIKMGSNEYVKRRYFT